MANNCSDKVNIIEKESHERKFYQSWLENEQFKPWLQTIPYDPFNCFCFFCNLKFRYGFNKLMRHSNSKKHVSECQKRGFSVDLNTHDDERLPFEDRKEIAEIKFTALIAEKNIPFETAESILSFFQDLGEDPEGLKSMRMNRNKTPKVIKNVLCVHEQERLVEKLQNNKFSIFVDETSDLTNGKWMTFLVRYVDPQTLNTELLELIHLDASDCSAEKLFTNFTFSNILALSCDNASVMTGKYESFKIKLQKHCKRLITMPCPCYASALVANAACSATSEACEELLRKVASFISSSPKRACIFEQFKKSFCFDGTCSKILKLSKTRWLSRHACVAKLNENWDVLLKFLQEKQLGEKSKSGAALLSLMQNSEIQAYLLFLEYILDVFNKFNASFRTEETKVHLLQSAAENLLKTVLKNVVKAPLLNLFRWIQLILCLRVIVYLLIKLWLEKLAKIFLISGCSFIAQRFGGFDEEILKEEWQFLKKDFTSEQKATIINLHFDEAWNTIMATKKADGKFRYPLVTSTISSFLELPITITNPNTSYISVAKETQIQIPGN
ncbi:hypothetical protein ALC57_17419 [Trachymyrmex cornetzi]|uniref:DUF4371 domain-containing protein n=1 Tax=Trachymyrmex cornetzi TaxID=471704 RepID=A0A151ITQ9_9HYME|nr:hypothetical protein ALC57_17419 [Trachymyrmex cornetzi]